MADAALRPVAGNERPRGDFCRVPNELMARQANPPPPRQTARGSLRFHVPSGVTTTIDGDQLRSARGASGADWSLLYDVLSATVVLGVVLDVALTGAGEPLSGTDG